MLHAQQTLGYEVLAINVDRKSIEKAAAGEAPFFYPGRESLPGTGLETGSRRFTTSYVELPKFGDLYVLCVATPEVTSSAVGLTYLTAAVDALASHLQSQCLIVGTFTDFNRNSSENHDESWDSALCLGDGRRRQKAEATEMVFLCSKYAMARPQHTRATRKFTEAQDYGKTKNYANPCQVLPILRRRGKVCA